MIDRKFLKNGMDIPVIRINVEDATLKEADSGG
jgi:hypothetical protein